MYDDDGRYRRWDIAGSRSAAASRDGRSITSSLRGTMMANAWRRDRWDSLRLLTPNWQCRLPGYHYDGEDPDGFMTASQVADFISGYAKAIAAPVMTGTTVSSVRRDGGGYAVKTDQGEWRSETVVIASGRSTCLVCRRLQQRCRRK